MGCTDVGIGPPDRWKGISDFQGKVLAILCALWRFFPIVSARSPCAHDGIPSGDLTRVFHRLEARTGCAPTEVGWRSRDLGRDESGRRRYWRPPDVHEVSVATAAHPPDGCRCRRCHV
jgi:hypothetical protein